MKREPKVKPVRAWVLVTRNGWIYRSTARMTKEEAESARRHDLMADAVPVEVEIRPAPKPSTKGAGTARPKGSERKRRKARKAKP